MGGLLLGGGGGGGGGKGYVGTPSQIIGGAWPPLPPPHPLPTPMSFQDNNSTVCLECSNFAEMRKGQICTPLHFLSLLLRETEFAAFTCFSQSKALLLRIETTTRKKIIYLHI